MIWRPPIQIFKNEQFGEIRTIIKDNEPWFVGKDVAKVLGCKNASKAIDDHVDDDDKLNNVSLSSLGQRGGWIINESGLYSLILSSKLPQAKEFKRWVTSVVLPQIRKTGGYIPVSEEDDEKTILAKAVGIMKRTIEQQDALIAAQKPKVEFADAVTSANDSILIRDLAKLITQNGVKIGQTRLFYWLRLNGYLFKNKDERRPIQKWVEMGIFDTTVSIIEACGRKIMNVTTKVTGKGQKYFLEGFISGRFKAENACWK